MNKHPLLTTAFATAALLALHLPASAQGITLAGVVDAAARQVKNEGRSAVESLVSGSNATSRLIVRGQENLNPELWAGFHLEHGIALDTGSPASSALFWDRRSTLSLGSKAWGELRAGRDFVPSYRNWSRHDPFGYVGVGSSSNLISATPTGPIRSAFGSNLNTTVRASNALQWLAPAGWGGVEATVMVAAGEGGQVANNVAKVLGAQLGWANKQFNVGVASTRSENSLTASGRFEDTGIGAGASLGPVRVSLARRQFKQNLSKQTNTLLGLWLPLGALELKASVTQVNLEGRVGATRIGSNDATQFGLGAVYTLSRRTAAYATLAQVKNDGAATFAVPGGAAGLAGGGSSRGMELGVRHNF